jgi:hypothetical protein
MSPVIPAADNAMLLHDYLFVVIILLLVIWGIVGVALASDFRGKVAFSVSVRVWKKFIFLLRLIFGSNSPR